MEDESKYYGYGAISTPNIVFYKGEIVSVKNKKGKTVKAKVIRGGNNFADVDVNGLTYLIDRNLTLNR